jgi:hypothetical protein
MIKIECRTLFDITATGVTGHYKSSQHKFKDITAWNRARNQQRNWETLTQILNLRTQIMSNTEPTYDQNLWVFAFESESNVWNDGTDPVGVLKADSDGVPMLRELNNDPDIEPVLVTHGARQNIWFDFILINNILENTDG